MLHPRPRVPRAPPPKAAPFLHHPKALLQRDLGQLRDPGAGARGPEAGPGGAGLGWAGLGWAGLAGLAGLGWARLRAEGKELDFDSCVNRLGTARIQLQEAPGGRIPLLEAKSHLKPYSSVQLSSVQFNSIQLFNFTLV